MNHDRRPPGLAFWLLSRLLRGRRSEALLGDLAEEYQHGRRRTWYWRQALSAIAADMREHPPWRFWLGALRLLLILMLVAASGLPGVWFLLCLLPLDPSVWWWLRRRKRLRDQASPRGHAPCDR